MGECESTCLTEHWRRCRRATATSRQEIRRAPAPAPILRSPRARSLSTPTTSKRSCGSRKPARICMPDSKGYRTAGDVRLARDPLWISRSRGRSAGRPIKSQTKAAIDAAMTSSVIEWRASFEAAIAITRIKMRAAQVMPFVTTARPDSQSCGKKKLSEFVFSRRGEGHVGT